jgi:hypothetical protein
MKFFLKKKKLKESSFKKEPKSPNLIDRFLGPNSRAGALTCHLNLFIN